MVGTPDSWDQVISFSGDDVYNSCTWSPCGQFVAAQTKRVVEIRNQLTFQLLTVLKFAEITDNSICRGSLVYSPDGQSLACSFSNAIVIWDIQTGGVVKEINNCGCVVSLVWSLDGRTIAITLGNPTPGVRTYDVTSGVQLFVEDQMDRLRSCYPPWEQPFLKTQMDRFEPDYHLWAHKKSFRFTRMELFHNESPNNVSIFEIGPTIAEIQSFSVRAGAVSAFSPLTHHISISYLNTLYIFNLWNSDCLLEIPVLPTSSIFSPDGCVFAFSSLRSVYVWKCTSTGYTWWRTFKLPSQRKTSIQFSPTSTSILSLCGSVLQVRHLHDHPITPKGAKQCAAISNSGHYIATALMFDNTITITNLHLKTPLQFITTRVQIEGLLITGNVLLVASSRGIVAWLLAEGGIVDGVLDNMMAGPNDSIWRVMFPPSEHCKSQDLVVGDQVGVIRSDGLPTLIYNTKTGELLKSVHELPNIGHPLISLHQLSVFWENYCLCYHNQSWYNDPPDSGWIITQAAMKGGGWIIDPSGRHRLWVPVEWRGVWNFENWYHDITTLFSKISDQLVIIKF